jgi:enoyl-[acyl-carrier protein] reductase I
MANDLLKGKRGIIFGALNDQSIAWKVAERAHEEGAQFVLTNAPIAMRMGEINVLAEKTGSKIIPADATSIEDLENLVTQSMEILGGKIDFVLHSIGMSPNVRKGKHYTENNYQYYNQTMDVSAISLHKTLATLYKHDAVSEWVKKISGPTTQEELEFLLSNGHKKILCDTYPKEMYKYRVFFKSRL